MHLMIAHVCCFFLLLLLRAHERRIDQEADQEVDQESDPREHNNTFPDLLAAEAGLDVLVAENHHRKTSRRSIPLIP